MSETLRYLITQAFEIEQKLLETSGEITPEIEAMIQTNDLKLPQKVDAYAGIMDRLTKSSQFFKDKAEKSKKIAVGLETMAETIKRRMKDMMIQNQIDELRGVEERFVLSKSLNAVQLVDSDKIPQEYLKTVITSRPDLVKIKEDLKDGKVIDGVTLIDSFTLRRYVNKGDR